MIQVPVYLTRNLRLRWGQIDSPELSQLKEGSLVNTLLLLPSCISFFILFGEHFRELYQGPCIVHEIITRKEVEVRVIVQEESFGFVFGWSMHQSILSCREGKDSVGMIVTPTLNDSKE